MAEADDHIVIDDVQAAQQIAEAVHIGYDPARMHCVARMRGDRLLGGVIFEGYTGSSIELHVAGFDPRWITRDILWAIFAFPFLQLNCKKVIGRVAETNRRALELDLKLGFIEEARIRDAYPEGDLIILTMRRDECRWLNIVPRSRFWEHPNGKK